MNTSQSTVTINKFVKVCDYYAELSYIVMVFERSRFEMCAVVISIANIYIYASFFRLFINIKMIDVNLHAAPCRCVVLRYTFGAEVNMAAFSQVGPVHHAVLFYTVCGIV